MSAPSASPAPQILNPPLTPRGSFRFQELGLVIVVAALTLALVAYGYHDANPDRGPRNTFFNTDNLIDGIATPMSYYAIMAAGMTVVIISGGIDISVASIMALSGLLTAWALQSLDAKGASPVIVGITSLFLPLLVGLACGVVNGTLVTALRMHPFIVTLGTMSIFRGICNVLPITKTLVVPDKFQSTLSGGSVTALIARPIGGTWEDGFNTGGMQLWPLAFMLVTCAAAWIFLSLLTWGRETYAVGGNEEAARFSGISVGGAKLRVYAISGMCAGLAGLVSLGRFGTISTNTGTGYELTVVAAAVVGGASLSGGRGTALGALLGTLILAEIENAINILKWNQDYKAIIVGAAIIVAVALDRVSELFRARRARGAH